MKVVYAATLEQRKMIDDLINHLITFVFPLYFDERDIYQLIRSRALDTPDVKEDWLDTAEDALRIISALQVIIALLEMKSLPAGDRNYKNLFNKNKRILERYQILFPFTYRQFAIRHDAEQAVTMFAKPANEYLL